MQTESSLLPFLVVDASDVIHLLIGVKEREAEFRFPADSAANSFLRGGDQRTR